MDHPVWPPLTISLEVPVGYSLDQRITSVRMEQACLKSFVVGVFSRLGGGRRQMLQVDLGSLMGMYM